jgi:seryl-tRNA synthetase
MQNTLHPNLRAAESSELLSAVAEWISLHNQRMAKIHEWQRLETQLFTLAKQIGISIEASYGSDRPEAQAMKALDEQIEELAQQTDDLAVKILAQPVGSLAEATAKIEVGLKLQGPEDWQPCALELVEHGLSAIRKRLE